MAMVMGMVVISDSMDSEQGNYEFPMAYGNVPEEAHKSGSRISISREAALPNRMCVGQGAIQPPRQI